ncbi:hypothetical protein Lsed01_00720 [Demequina sediminis]|uniref:Uncharacterized protein n=1 Tax=Demequina sediminis TaxID=1930058 RepID=A0ABP9WGE4_9MICO
MAALEGLLLAQPGRGELGVGEDHGGQAGVVDPRPRTVRAGQCVGGGGAACGGGDVDVLRGTGHVACGVDARVGRALELIRDDETPLVDVDAGCGEPQPVGAGRATGGDQQPFCADGSTRGGPYDDLASVDRDGDGVLLEDTDAVLGKDRTQGFGQLRLGPGGHAPDQGHPRTETGQELRLLEPDVAATDHHQGPRHLLEFHGRRRRQPVHAVQTRQLGHRRRGPGGHHVRLGAQRLAVDRERVAIEEPGVPRHDLEPMGGGDVGVLRTAHALDELVLLVNQRS